MDLTMGNRSAASGRFNFVIDPLTRDVSFDETEAHAVLTSALEDLGTNPFDRTHGSELHTLQSLTGRTPSVATAMVLQSQDPLVRAGKIVAPTATGSGRLTLDGLGRLDLALAWTTPGGKEQKEEL